ncbi:MAG: peptidoglycan-binding domain-containing protein, partial [bacterium]|nr:peptidoglycan-binding domain-containing protein [bacterium]
ADAATCVDLFQDIGQGSSGSTVLLYQNFLKEQGLLTAVPNGHFGPATLAATKAFQASRNISTTGLVGPLTRAALKIVSCTPVVAAPSGNQTAPSTTAPSVMFSSSVTDQVLYLGDTYKVSWSSPKNSDLILVIEDANGVNKGSISGYLGSAQNYEWEVGQVNVSGVNSQVNLVPDRYRFRLQGRMDGKMQTDAVSPYFTVQAPNVTISHMYPTTIVADGKTPGVLYGTGFTAGITAYLDDSRDKALKLMYASPDAKLMVFTVPKGIPTGRYRMVLRNNYGSSFEGGMIQVTN